jgi:hypothetical protein
MSGPFPVIQCREDALSLVTDSVFEVAVYQRVESVAFNGGEDRLGGRSCARSWSIDRCAGRRSVNTSSTASVKVNRSAVIGVRARAGQATGPPIGSPIASPFKRLRDRKHRVLAGAVGTPRMVLPSVRLTSRYSLRRRQPSPDADERCG